MRKRLRKKLVLKKKRGFARKRKSANVLRKRRDRKKRKRDDLLRKLKRRDYASKPKQKLNVSDKRN